MSVESMILSSFPEYLTYIIPIDGVEPITEYKDDALNRVRDIWNSNGVLLCNYINEKMINSKIMSPMTSKDEAVKSLSNKILESVRANNIGMKQKQLYDITNQLAN